jgi:hypothetical protein
VVQGIPFIGAAQSQLSGEFRGVLSTGKLMQNMTNRVRDL